MASRNALMTAQEQRANDGPSVSGKMAVTIFCVSSWKQGNGEISPEERVMFDGNLPQTLCHFVT